MERDEWADSWTYGYDLDGGGYAFERTNIPGLEGDVLMWDDPDPDYFPFGTDETEGGFYRHSLVTLYVDIGVAEQWPESFETGYGTMVRLSVGCVYDSEHECLCRGWNGEDDEPHPDCERCEGEGYLDSPGGTFAWYGLKEEEE